MTDKERNTFKYKGYDVTVAVDCESKSGLSFSIPDRSIPNGFSTFAYFDDVDNFIKSGCNWETFLGKS